jgi:hypothetical protein
MDFPVPGPHWLALVAALGVLLTLALWWVVTDERWSAARPAVTVAGAVLLLTTAGLLVRRIGTLTYVAAGRGSFLPSDSGHAWLDVGLAAVGVAAGLAFATYAAGDDDRPADVGVPAPAPEYIPARAWSPTEVLGDAPGEPDDEEPDEESYGDADEDPDEPRVPITARVLDRGVTVPLLAVALALALPTQVLPGFGGLDRTAYPANADRVLRALLAGLLVGGALLGAALALDVWERRRTAAAFALLVVGVVLGVLSPRILGNEYWTVCAWGLSAGLVAPAVLRVLHRPVWGGRSPLLVGVAGAVLLLGANDAMSARAQRVERFGGIDVNVDDSVEPVPSDFPTDFPTDVPTDVFPTDFPTDGVVVP